jgi:hypothetical protein
VAEQRDLPRTLELAKKTTEMAPLKTFYWDLCDSWGTYGVVLYRTGDWKGAITNLEKAIGLRVPTGHRVPPPAPARCPGQRGGR